MANQVVLQFGSIIIALNAPFANPVATHPKLLISIILIYILHLAIPTCYVARSAHSYNYHNTVASYVGSSHNATHSSIASY